jgi:hypothetical protein
MRYYHTGMIVSDIDTSVASFAALGVTFTRTRRVKMTVCCDGRVQDVELLVVYSTNGEPYLELVQDVSGGIWSRPGARMDHIGVWTDDMPADLARFAASGFTPHVTGIAQSPELGPSFAYLKGPGPLYVELVSTRGRAQFEKEWLTTSHVAGDWFEL